MAVFIYPPQQVTIPGAATEATLLDVLAETQSIDTTLSAVNQKLAASFFTEPYDTLQVVTKSAAGPTQIVSKIGGLSGSIVQTLNIVYDLDGDFESAVVS